ncbi:MAG TPA: hypothetical protein VK081_15095, partial [Planctomycetota bacterium]|nr:hypothetical protein [Planctomycetota bacterium]
MSAAPLGPRRPAVDRQCGTTFVELMGAITIISIATLVMLQQLTISYREGTTQQDRLWAFDKATQIMSELQSAAERGGIPDAEALHALADADYNPVLTTVVADDGTPLPADHPMSGNWQRFSRWVWARKLTVASPPGQDRVRHVTLEIAKANDDGAWVTMASMTNLLTLPRRSYPMTTVYDVYVLALAEVPSPLGELPRLRSELEAAMRAATSRAPGVEFRVHWITRLGYGRDPLYTPYVNTEHEATAVPEAPVYWYPGLAADGARLFCSEYFTGRHRTDAGVVNEYDPVDRPYPHAIADRFNHCLRLPEARAAFAERVAAGLEDEREPTLQILLADLVENPERYRNAILLNLHGDGLPFPPVRNYSDAASAPETHPGVRVVTHPARLRAVRDANGDGNPADSDDLELRVYAFKQDPAEGAAVLDAPITVQIFGGDVRAHLTVRRLPGGIDPSTGAPSAAVPYSGFDTSHGEPPATDPGTFEMWCETGYSTTPEPHTWIRLHNTPLTCPASGTQGLAASDRLYGLEYVPAPLGVPPFTRDLAANAAQPKNTARWRIRIARTALGAVLPNLDQAVTVATRIGTDLGTGVAWPTTNQPRNRSVTYAWWARAADAVPPLERFQFLGDPRHNPYADVASAHGYNCCFSGSGISLAPGAWNAIDPARLRESGFGEGVTADAPRALWVWRTALQRAGVLFVNAAPPAERLYLGGEWCAPSPDGGITPGKVALPGVLFAQPGVVLVDSVSCGPCTPAAPPGEPMATLGGEHVVVGPGTFWARPWLGELYADADYADWYAGGNLPAGTRYHREVRSQTTLPHMPTGAVFYGIPAGATAGAIGGTAFAAIGTPSRTFSHRFAAGAVGTLTTQGRVVPRAFGFEGSSSGAARRPFTLSLPGDPTAPHFRHPSDFPVQSEQLVETHATSSLGWYLSAGLVRVADASGASTFLELLCAPAADTAALFELALAQAVRGFQAAGHPALAGRIEQIGRVEVVAPQKGGVLRDPGAIQLSWRVDFLGFDGGLPTETYPTGFSENENALRYSVLYSHDGGRTWYRALDHAPAEPGVRPPDALLLADAGTGNETFSLPTPASTFPAGELLLRV